VLVGLYLTAATEPSARAEEKSQPVAPVPRRIQLTVAEPLRRGDQHDGKNSSEDRTRRESAPVVLRWRRPADARPQSRTPATQKSPVRLVSATETQDRPGRFQPPSNMRPVQPAPAVAGSAADQPASTVLKEAPVRLRLVVQASANQPLDRRPSTAAERPRHPASRLATRQPAEAAPIPVLNPPQQSPRPPKAVPPSANRTAVADEPVRVAQQTDSAPPRVEPPAEPKPKLGGVPNSPRPLAGMQYSQERCRQLNDESVEVRTAVRENVISKISLDITPSRRENLRDPAVDQVRDWRDRNGKVVARGKFSDFKNGRIWVETVDGKTVQLPYPDLSDEDHCFVAFVWGIPVEFALDDVQYQGRNWVASSFAWKASEVSHKPTYFEEVQLERYGHTLHPLAQPFVSGAHFFLNIAVLPYKMGIHPLHECQYPLGYYRPGSCAPWLLPPVPLSVRGGLAEAGVILGGIFALP